MWLNQRMQAQIYWSAPLPNVMLGLRLPLRLPCVRLAALLLLHRAAHALPLPLPLCLAICIQNAISG